MLKKTDKLAYEEKFGGIFMSKTRPKKNLEKKKVTSPEGKRKKKYMNTKEEAKNIVSEKAGVQVVFINADGFVVEIKAGV